MKTLSITVAAVLMAAAIQTTAHAQPNAGVKPGYGYQPYYGHQYGPIGPYYHHASTAAEGYLNGWANRVYAQGLYNRLNAEARVIHANARSQEIANSVQGTDAYFTKRAMNRAARAAARGPRASAEELAQRAKDAAPKRLSDLQLSATGQINWPELLQGREYADYRAELEYIVLYRKANGNVDTQQRKQARETTIAMLAQLKTQIREVSVMEYSQAQQFIKSLAHETQLPIG